MDHHKDILRQTKINQLPIIIMVLMDINRIINLIIS